MYNQIVEKYSNADMVEKPNHYVKIVNGKEHECKDTIEIITADAEKGEAFYLGNATKYIWRYKSKNGKEDLLKAIKNIKMLIEMVYGGKNDNN